MGEPTKQTVLLVEVTTPEGATDEEILKFVEELVLKADDYHRALGGHGLKLDFLKIVEASDPISGRVE